MIHVALVLALGSYFVLLLWCRKQGNQVTTMRGRLLASAAKWNAVWSVALAEVVRAFAKLNKAMERVRGDATDLG